jgi:hypothetical protein
VVPPFIQKPSQKHQNLTSVGYVTIQEPAFLLRELGSGKVGYNKYELVNVMVRKADEAYLAGYISKAENIRTW